MYDSNKSPHWDLHLNYIEAIKHSLMKARWADYRENTENIDHVQISMAMLYDTVLKPTNFLWPPANCFAFSSRQTTP